MKLPHLERRPELDALRGLFLVWMTLTHLPTRFSDYANQPLGFVSSAEGFVFISALLVGRLYIRDSLENPASVRVKLWKRSLQIYAYHLLMLALLSQWLPPTPCTPTRLRSTICSTFTSPHPFVAIVGSVFLIYCPPLLDILPMYVMFLFLYASAALCLRAFWLEMDSCRQRPRLAAGPVRPARPGAQLDRAYHPLQFLSRKPAPSISLPGRACGWSACGSGARIRRR